MRLLRCLRKRAALAGVPTYIEHFSKFSPSPLSMKQFLDFGESPPPPIPGNGPPPDRTPLPGVQPGERQPPPGSVRMSVCPYPCACKQPGRGGAPRR